jgi:hypothetical protein
MKKILIFLVVVLVTLSSFTNEKGIDEKLQQSFRNSFPNAQEISWMELSDSYVVYFVESGIKARIVYPKDQSYIRFMRYYNESALPYHLRFLVNKNYPGKKIFGVTEISTVSQTDNSLTDEYFVRIEDSKNWLVVKIDNEGNLSVVGNYKKLLQVNYWY